MRSGVEQSRITTAAARRSFGTAPPDHVPARRSDEHLSARSPDDRGLSFEAGCRSRIRHPVHQERQDSNPDRDPRSHVRSLVAPYDSQLLTISPLRHSSMPSSPSRMSDPAPPSRKSYRASQRGGRSPCRHRRCRSRLRPRGCRLRSHRRPNIRGHGSGDRPRSRETRRRLLDHTRGRGKRFAPSPI